ncbi:hypothetical protein EPA93_12885 [Ktedonosporobacter rubrisoli]|uniref:Uncharacterized protein n=1 Tax=Ktedonosporobacter rubrisoli TaxID=2509675 RepID=A0A4P6JNZ7_KTERU|nr:hypothetical protein [Ktedonosporobacter rubrisoli]QBD76850.1 hypothetical protein EPA93_12885 [Ktedonosporobacter rubrisoli]
MNYDLVVARKDILDQLPTFLASFFQVAVQDVCIVDWQKQFDLDEEKWSSILIFCSYERCSGDFAWSLSLFATINFPDVYTAGRLPTEEALAIHLAETFNTVVRFPLSLNIHPSASWLATPRGEVFCAYAMEGNLVVIDGEEYMPYFVYEVEFPVPELPHARVTHFPDIINELEIKQRPSTPICDTLTIQLENSHLSTLSNPASKALSVLSFWEVLILRMSHGWAREIVIQPSSMQTTLEIEII